jgi:predicted GTPase
MLMKPIESYNYILQNVLKWQSRILFVGDCLYKALSIDESLPHNVFVKEKHDRTSCIINQAHARQDTE